MMDCGKKTLIFLTLCALVRAQNVQRITNILEILVSVPSTHIGDTEIGSTVFTSSAGHPFKFTVVAQKNQTQCINSTDPLCTSMIKEPKVDVSVSSRGSNGNSFTYSNSTNGSQELVIYIDSKVTLTPQILNGGSDNITIILDVLYDRANTSRGSFSSIPSPTTLRVKAEFFTTAIVEENNGEGNGQSTLHSGPLSALILLALLPLLLLK